MGYCGVELRYRREGEGQLGHEKLGRLLVDALADNSVGELRIFAGGGDLLAGLLYFLLALVLLALLVEGLTIPLANEARAGPRAPSGQLALHLLEARHGF